MKNIVVREMKEFDLPEMITIWNQVVAAGDAFPQDLCLNKKDGKTFFKSQSYVGVAEDMTTAKLVGLYILHPSNTGRCSHICNASYAVAEGCRGNHVGEKLVKDCIVQGKKEGFRVLQFNAVVESNAAARHLYEKLGFTQLGTIPGGFYMKDGTYANICPYYCEL